MKIAVMMIGDKVSGHFGQSDGIRVFNIDNNKILSEDKLNAQSHSSGSMPTEVINTGAEVIISGGMGKGAYSKLTEKNIKVYMTNTVNPVDAVMSYFEGGLELGKPSCSGHGHHGSNHVCACIK